LVADVRVDHRRVVVDVDLAVVIEVAVGSARERVELAILPTHRRGEVHPPPPT
jgi:hypothetical protein